MQKTAKKMNEVTNEIIELVMGLGFTQENIKKMSPEEFKMVQLVFELLTLNNELTEKTAELLESIDKKLDNLASKTES